VRLSALKTLINQWSPTEFCCNSYPRHNQRRFGRGAHSWVWFHSAHLATG